MENVVNADEVVDMVRHWLYTPPNRYFGSDYGSELKSLLQKPMLSNEAEILIQKIKKDIPILEAIPNSVNLYMQELQGRPDAKRLIIEVLGVAIDALNPKGEIST